MIIVLKYADKESFGGRGRQEMFLYEFKYEGNEGHYYQIKPTLIGPVDSNPEVDEMVYETKVTIDNDRQGGEVRVRMKRFPPIGPHGTRIH